MKAMHALENLESRRLLSADPAAGHWSIIPDDDLRPIYVNNDTGQKMILPYVDSKVQLIVRGADNADQISIEQTVGVSQDEATAHPGDDYLVEILQTAPKEFAD